MVHPVPPFSRTASNSTTVVRTVTLPDLQQTRAGPGPGRLPVGCVGFITLVGHPL